MSFLKSLLGKSGEEEFRKQLAWKCGSFSTQFLGALKYSGEQYAEIRGVGGDVGELIAFLDFSSKLGDPIALFCRGEFYQRGVGTDCNIYQAETYYRRAYHQGDLPALIYWIHAALRTSRSRDQLEELAELLESDSQKAADFSEVLMLKRGDRQFYTEYECILYRLALAGDAEAQLKLAKHWILMQDSPSSSKVSDRRKRMQLELVESAARQGSSEAQALYATVLSEKKAPLSECLIWAVLAARKGAPHAASFLASVAEVHGDGVLKTAEEAANAVKIEESPITFSARVTKTLLDDNDRHFPKNWESLIELF